jgi:AmmeMemoRadiSam system protein B
VRAYEKLKNKLLELKPETIIIISSHSDIRENIFTINSCPKFIGGFEDFGNFSVKKIWKGDVGLIGKLSEALETKNKLSLVTKEKIDHGISIPLFKLTEDLPNIKIIPLSFSGLSNREHFEFGKLLKKEIVNCKKRIAVIASGDLSHRLTRNAPAGYSPKGKKFDKKIIELLLKNNIEKIINMDEKLIKDAGECGFRSILILLGIMHNIKNVPKLLSYEFPFGVGYMVMDFEL